MADVILGRLSRIKLNGVVVAKMNSMSITFNNATIDITSFGDEVAKFARAMRSWTASISGFYNKLDASQNTLLTAAEDGDENADVEFYLDSTAHYKVDVISDSEATVIFDSLTVTSDNNSVVSFDLSLTGSGPLKYYAS